MPLRMQGVVRRSSWLSHAALCSTVWIYCGEEGGCNNGYGEVAPYQSCGLRHQDIQAVSGAHERDGWRAALWLQYRKYSALAILQLAGLRNCTCICCLLPT